MRFVKTILLLFVIVSVAMPFDTEIIANAEAKIGKQRTKAGRKGKKAAVENVWERLCSGLRIPVFGPSPYGSEQLAALPSRINTTPPKISMQKQPGSSAANDKTSRVSSVIIPKKSTKEGGLTADKPRIRHVLGSNKGTTNATEDNIVKDHYTAFGRSKLAPKEPLNPKLRHLYKNPGNERLTGIEGIKDGGLFNSDSIHRIRTRLNLHPELFKNANSKNKELATDAIPKTDGIEVTKGQLAITGCADFNKSNIIPLVKQGLLSSHNMELAEECRLRQNAAYDRISRHLGGYSKAYLQKVGERARPFLYHIVNALSKHGLPMDLALLPIVESAYQPTALSSASAAGIWQFIPSTGKVYGLSQTAYYDARLNVTAETQAAVRFLAALREHYGGDWWLALAAYNAGPGTVDAAISRNVAAGLGRDFWSLELPQETMDYVPRLLALSSIFRNLGPSGLNLRPLKNEPYFIEVAIDRDIDIKRLANKDLSAVAQLASYDAEEFSFLNAAYLKPTMPPSKSLSFLMPIRNANMLHQSLAFLEQADKSEKPVELPTTVFAQAGHANTEIPLLAVNIEHVPNFFANHGKSIHVSGVAYKSTDKTEKETTANLGRKEDWVVHYLDKGESLTTVAEHHGIDEEILREVNNFKRKQIISLGQRLLVPLKFLTLNPIKKRHPSVLFNGLSDNSGFSIFENRSG